MTFIDRTGRHTQRGNAILNADACVDAYAPFSARTLAADHDLWYDQCLAEGFVTDHLERVSGGAWQSPDALIERALASNKQEDLYRRYVSGNLAGTSVLVRENGTAPDTAY